MYLPSTGAVAQQLGELQPQAKNMWMEFALQCLPSAKEYFQQRSGVGSVLHPLVEAFHAARLCHRRKVAKIHPNAEDVEGPRYFPFITEEDVAAMNRELPQCLAAVEDVQDVDPVI